MTRIPPFCVRTLGLGALSALLAGCGALDYSTDLANNELFYADVPFVSEAPGDRSAFVAPVVDDRTATPLPLAEKGFPIRYGTDEFWERPVPKMVDDILERQLGRSELFPAIAAQAAPDAVVVKPTLVAFHVGAQEGMSGSMSFAEVGLRLQVYGPVGKDGERPLWHDHVYGNRQVSEYGVKPISPYRLIGRAMQLTMSNALNGLDGSNVARSGVPIEPVEPLAVPASVRRR